MTGSRTSTPWGVAEETSLPQAYSAETDWITELELYELDAVVLGFASSSDSEEGLSND